jgi:hypothetical protein
MAKKFQSHKFNIRHFFLVVVVKTLFRYTCDADTCRAYVTPSSLLRDVEITKWEAGVQILVWYTFFILYKYAIISYFC